MIHWSWLIAAFVGGAICGAVTLLGLSCCIVGGLAEEKERKMMN